MLPCTGIMRGETDPTPRNPVVASCQFAFALSRILKSKWRPGLEPEILIAVKFSLMLAKAVQASTIVPPW